MDGERAASAVGRIREGLDRVVVGHGAAKEASILGVLARQHVLLEGPTGSGRSLLASTLSMLVASERERHLVAMHREIRREDLLGDLVLRRDRLRDSERMSFTLRPGPLLRCALLVVDDLGRAPGEALTPLLGLLGSRRTPAGLERVGGGGAGAGRLPLECAIATLATEAPGSLGTTPVVDALEPTQADRFALQVQVRGLVVGRRWRSGRELLERSLRSTADAAVPTHHAAMAPVIDRDERRALQGWVASRPLPGAVVAACTTLLDELAELLRRRRRRDGGAAGDGSLLSDRTFGAALPSLLRAHCVLRGAGEVGPEDLRVLRAMVARRLPPELADWLGDRIERLLAPPPEIATPAAGASGPALDGGDAGEGGGTAVAAPPGPSVEGELPPDPESRPSRRRPRPADVAPLLRAFEGVLDRGRSELDEDAGGQPRGFRPLRRLDELLDADTLDLALLADGVLAGAPRVARRQRRILGGAVIVARDVSSSMAGFRNDWASELICGVVRAAARRRMQVGYLEFHQRAMPRRLRGRLLHRRYRELEGVVREAVPLGQTNYEAPLRLALDALRGRRGRNRHVVLLTDGLPILGDTRVRAERALAAALGVQLHTVFIGEGDCPEVLDDVSVETGGLRFQATETGAGLVLRPRPGVPPAAWSPSGSRPGPTSMPATD